MRDLIVAGGGPVGLATALYAARAGLDVVVREPRGAPVDKACGEGLMPGAVADLSRLGIEPTGVELTGIRYCDPHRSVDAPFRAGPGRGVRRTTLHSALAAAAAAAGVVIEPDPVRTVEQRGDRVLVDGQAARHLVAADGLHSPVRRMLGLEAPRRGQRRFGLRRHLALAPWTSFVEVHWSPRAEAYVTPVAPDCVGLAVLTSDGGDFEDLLSAFPALAERVEGAHGTRVLGAGPLRQRVTRRVAGRRAARRRRVGLRRRAHRRGHRAGARPGPCGRGGRRRRVAGVLRTRVAPAVLATQPADRLAPARLVPADAATRPRARCGPAARRLQGGGQRAGPAGMSAPGERVVLLSETGEAVGTADKASVHHASTPLHLAFSCYVLDDADRLLVTQRARSKRTFPGVWTNSCCGHPAPDEPVETAVRRRVRQELGLGLGDLRLVLPEFRYAAEMDGVREHELCPVFVARAVGEVSADPAEVEDWEWVPWAGFRATVLSGGRSVSQWCREQVAALPEDLALATARPASELPPAARP